MVVGNADSGEEFRNLLLGQHGGEGLRAFGFQVTEDVPLAMQNLLEEEFERAVADAQGRRGPTVDVVAVKKVILKLHFGNQVRGLAVEIHQHAHHGV